MDLVITGATVVLEDRVEALHVGIAGGRIAALVDGAATPPSAARTIAADGLMLLPGAIDAHTHFTAGHDDVVPEIRHGTAGAAKAGVTTVIEMPHMNPPATTLARFLAKRELFGANSCVDFALWGGLTGENLAELRPMHEAGAVAMKGFTCSGRRDRAPGDARGLPGLDDDDLNEAFREVAGFDGLVGLHSENHDIIQGNTQRLRAAGADGGRAHAAAQPEVAETEAVTRAIHLAGRHGARLHVVHLSTGDAARIISAARVAGGRVTVETCPQYLVLNEDDLERLGAIARCGPPIRPQATVDDLWREVEGGTIDALTSDHCPYPWALKDTATIWQAAMGLTGIETTTPIFVGAALARGIDPRPDRPDDRYRPGEDLRLVRAQGRHRTRLRRRLRPARPRRRDRGRRRRLRGPGQVVAVRLHPLDRPHPPHLSPRCGGVFGRVAAHRARLGPLRRARRAMTATEYFLAQVLNGLSAGSIYALIAVGYSMVFGVLQMHNFAHGDTLMFGTFFAMALTLGGVPVILAIPLAIALGGILGLAIERIAFRPTRNAHRMVPTVSAIGVALIIRNTAQQIWGTTTQPFPIDIPVVVVRVFGIGITSTQFAVFGVALALMAATDLFVRKTKIGKAMRAVQQDIDAAGYMGIPVNRTIGMVYLLGGSLAVAGGILFAINYNTVYLMMGFTAMMKAFVAAVIGGIGNIKGAFVGGLVLGVAEALAAAYFDTGYKDGIAMALLILVLLVRPQGLFGRPIQVKV